MTWKHYQWARKQRIECPYAKAVLKELATLAKPSGEVCISCRALSDNLALSLRTIKRAITKLAGDGLIERRRRTNVRGFRAADVYRVLGACETPRPRCQSDTKAKVPESHRTLPRNIHQANSEPICSTYPLGERYQVVRDEEVLQ